MEKDPQPNKCPKCGGIVSTGKAGTITQWIATCNCSVAPSDEDTQAEIIEICAACGKRINPGRSGTFTQWIFRLDLCTCEEPKPVKQLVEQEEPLKEEDVEFFEEEEQEAEVHPDKFPVDRYLPISIVGQGSSGTVFLARDKLLNKRVAVKTLHTLEPALQVSFQKEAKATSMLSHPGIVQVFDFGITGGGTPFMAMEFVEGVSLYDQVTTESTLATEEVIEVFATVCDALNHAHEKGILHRDIKSSNILLNKIEKDKFDVRLIDFGVAAMQTHHNQEDSQAKTMVGSPAYMSPDSALGNEYDERSEIYGLGCTIFEALTGRTPFISESSLETIRQHAHEKPPLISDIELEVEFQPELVQLVDKCLNKAPEDRYQSMRELKEELISIKSLLVEESKPEEPARVVEWTQLKNITRVPKQVLFTICLTIFVIGLSVMVMTFKNPKEEETNVVEPELPITSLTDVIAEAVEPHFSETKIGPGKIQVRSRGKIRFKHLDKLKDKGPIYNLIFEGNKVTDKWLEKIVDVPIVNLYVKGQPLTNDAIPLLEKIDGLKGLTISRTKIDDNGLKRLVENVSLTKLDFGGPSTTDKSLKIVSKLNSLTSVSIENSKGITSSGFSYLKKLPNLERLEITACSLEPGVLDVLGRSQLKKISFTGQPKISDRDIRFISVLKPESLDISKSGITEKAVARIAKLKSLESLALMNCHITDKHLKNLSAIPNLVSLDLRTNDITSDGVKYLKKIKSLEKLDVRLCKKLKGKDIAALKSALPKCAISNLTEREKDNQAFAEVTNSLLESQNQMREYRKRQWNR